MLGSNICKLKIGDFVNGEDVSEINLLLLQTLLEVNYKLPVSKL
jgi:hypothetical protein